MDQFDPWQVVARQVSTSYSRPLISTASVVVSRVGCLGVSGVMKVTFVMFCENPAKPKMGKLHII